MRSIRSLLTQVRAQAERLRRNADPVFFIIHQEDGELLDTWKARMAAAEARCESVRATGSRATFLPIEEVEGEGTTTPRPLAPYLQPGSQP